MSLPNRIRLGRAAELLGCSVRMAQKLALNGELPAARIGRLWTTTEAAVAAFLARSETARCLPTSTAALARPIGHASRSTGRISDEAYERMIGLRKDKPTRNVRRVQRALEEGGVISIAENGEGARVRLRKSTA